MSNKRDNKGCFAPIGDQPMVNMGVRVPIEVKKMLEEKGASQKKSATTFAREILEDWFKKKQQSA